MQYFFFFASLLFFRAPVESFLTSNKCCAFQIRKSNLFDTITNDHYMGTILQSTSTQKLEQTFSNVVKFIRTTNYSLLFSTILKFVSIRDVAAIAALLLYHKKILRLLHSAEKKLGSIVPEYEQSIFGYIERPVSFVALAAPIVYVFDLLLIAMQHLRVNSAQIITVERIVKFLLSWFLFGSFVTRLKDWIASKRRLIMFKDSSKRDPVKEQLTNDITSSIIWVILLAGFFESLHLPIERLGLTKISFVYHVYVFY